MAGVALTGAVSRRYSPVPMFRASDLKKGDVVRIDGDPLIVETVKVQTPSGREG